MGMLTWPHEVEKKLDCNSTDEYVLSGSRTSVAHAIRGKLSQEGNGD